MHKQRVIIIGIDGGTWDVFNPMIEQGLMPDLLSLKTTGCSGILMSTDPPSTPPGWTTLMTGMLPGKHRVIGFDEYDHLTDTMRYTNSSSIAVETMWSYLSRLGYRVASLNMPQTYPPFQVNGIMVSGFGCPGMDCQFSWPPAFKQKILDSIPDYDLTLGWNGGQDMIDPQAFSRAITTTIKRLDYERQLFDLACQECDWDILLFQLHQIDSFLHRGWGYTIPGALSDRPHLQSQLHKMFQAFDKLIGYLAASCQPNGSVMIVSDHGHGPAPKAQIKPNVALRQTGYLKTRRSLKRIGNRIIKNCRKLTGKTTHFQSGETRIREKLMIDARHTRAFCINAVGYCSVVINLKGRQKEGIVEPSDYHETINNLKHLFESIEDPDSGNKIFQRAVTPAELYGIDARNDCRFGDVIFFPYPQYGLSRSTKGDSILKYSSNPYKGCHRKEGMYVLNGPSFKSGLNLNASIADIVPTLYGIMQVDLPENLDGRILHEALNYKLETQYTNSAPVTDTGTKRLSESDEALIHQRLVNMGYL